MMLLAQKAVHLVPLAHLAQPMRARLGRRPPVQAHARTATKVEHNISISRESTRLASFLALGIVQADRTNSLGGDFLSLYLYSTSSIRTTSP